MHDIAEKDSGQRNTTPELSSYKAKAGMDFHSKQVLPDFIGSVEAEEVQGSETEEWLLANWLPALENES